MKYSRSFLLSLVVAGLLLFGPIGAVADDGPSMEAGIGLVTQSLADYRGSKHYQLRVLPVPYFLYNGEFIKADREGIRGEFFSNGRYELNISVDASLNGDGDDNKMRLGMPALDNAIELGPSFNINVSGRDFSEGWAVRFPLRAVFTLSSQGISHIGYLFNPRMTWGHPNIIDGWRASLNVGSLFGDRKYHSYYYDVSPPYATSDRPVFQTAGGYSGSFTRLALYKKSGDWRFGISLRYDYLGGAEFVESPLVETHHFATLSFGIVRTLWTRN